jgi:hypothetical protein
MKLGIHDLSKDLMDLYCKTKISKVEDLYIKLAQSDNSFAQWLNRNKGIKNQLKNPTIYDALQVLIAIRNKYPSAVTTADMAKWFIGSTQARYLSSLLSFSKQLNNSDVGDLLSPFSDILMALSKFQGGTEVDVLPDLIVIKNAFASSANLEQKVDVIPQKKNKYDKMAEMFSYLFNRFSNDIAGAADKGGLTDFSREVRNGALLKPEILGKYVDVTGTPSYMIKKTNKVLSDVTKKFDERFQNSNYEFIKEQLMYASGAVGDEEIHNLIREREKVDISDLTFPSNKPREKLAVTEDQWLDPFFISMLFTFFYQFYGYVKRLF